MLSGTETMANHLSTLWPGLNSIQGLTKTILYTEQKERMCRSCLKTRFLNQKEMLMSTRKKCGLQKLFKFSKSCFSFRSQDARRIDQFVHAYRRDRRHKIESLSEVRIESMLLKYMEMLDNLFFFGLLTRDNQEVSTQRFVRLQTLTEPWTNANENLGEFTPDPLGSQHRIDISTYGDLHRERSVPLPLGHLLGTLAHEMVHAYFYLFANHESAGFRASWNPEKLGHCQVFWALLRFIMKKLVDWIPECEDLLYQQCRALKKDSREGAEDLFEKLIKKRRPSELCR